MPSATRALYRAARIAERQRHEVGEEFRERRLQLDQSQDQVAAACHMSRVHYGQIENGRIPKLTILEVNRIAAVIGLTPSLRVYPAGPPIRDAGQATRLLRSWRQLLRLCGTDLKFHSRAPKATTSKGRGTPCCRDAAPGRPSSSKCTYETFRLSSGASI